MYRQTLYTGDDIRFPEVQADQDLQVNCLDRSIKYNYTSLTLPQLRNGRETV